MIFNLIGIALAISVPVFYLWGFFAFVQTVFGKKKDPPSSSYQALDEEKSKFVDYFFERVEDSPDLTLQGFLQEVRDARKQAIAERTTQAELASAVSPQSVFSTAITDGEEPETTFSELASNLTPPSEPTPQTFSWGEWYADHSIDFILYLGAFMMVAAVSLFVGFQWETFDSFTRFGIVLAFTASWFIAGIAVQRFLSLDGVTIAFMTIGSILIPFCGLAWQRFVIGTMDNVGITWLITSLLGTLIYMMLSLFYQRRHFTYFGNLSILATILSLVNVTASPAEYYVLAGAFTATVLLAGRVAVKTFAPRLDAYLGQDVENSSLAILIFSVIAGIILIPLTGLSFFSVEVLAVMLATLLFAFIYLSQHFNRYVVVITQSLTILTFSHALLTFDLDYRIALYTVLITSIAVQLILNGLLEKRFPEICAASNIVGLLVSSITYAFSINLFEGTFFAIPVVLMLMANAIYYAIRFKSSSAWYLVSILSYLLLAHILLWLNIEYEYWTSPYILLSAIQLVPIAMTAKKRTIEAFVYPALIALGIAGMMSLAILNTSFSISTLVFTLNVINPFVVLVLYAFVIFAETGREETIFNNLVPVALASLSILYFIASIELEPLFIATLLALSVSVLFWLAQKNTGLNQLFFVVFAAPFFALYYTLFALDIPLEIYPIAYAILSAITYFAVFLPEETDVPRQVVAVLATAFISGLAFNNGIYDGSMTLQLTGWVSAYTGLFMLWNSRSLLGGDFGDVVFSIAVYLQYVWHIVFLQIYVDPVIFSDPQWYSAALASILLIAMLNLLRRDSDHSYIEILQFAASAILMLPTLGQIVNEQSLLYFGLGVVYSLIIAAIGITLSQTRMRTIAAISLVLVVLSQSSEFLLNLPRWMVVGVIGFGLIGAGLYLSIRRRNVKKQLN